MSMAIRGMGVNQYGEQVEGYFRTYDVKVTYKGTVEVFVPLGEDAEDVMYDKMEGMALPAFIDDLWYDDEEYKEV